MEVIEQTPERVIIRMNADESFANGIRRSVNEIPVLAVDQVEILKNDSALYDEFLAHRIGLIPLKTETDMKEKTEIDLKLSKTGLCTVYSGDFKGGAEVVYEKMPLTLLEKDQELELVATARLGKGVEHDKYIPGLCYYRHILEVTAKNAHIDKIIEQSHGGMKPEKRKDVWFCDLNEALADEIEKIDAGAIRDSDELLLFVESFGHMAAKDILLQALRALGENLKEFEKALR